MPAKFTRRLDSQMRDQGETDYQRRLLRVNPVKSKRKSSIIDSMVHEETHRIHPRMKERTVRATTKRKLRTMSPGAKRRLRGRYR